MSKEIIIDGVKGIWTPTEEVPDELPEGYVSPHFRLLEFTCNHCERMTNDPPQELLDLLEDLRSHFGGQPITINSAYRCKTHNTNVGSSEKSRHRAWDAVDIAVKNVAPSKVADYLESQDPGRWGIGRYPDSGFTHVDTRGYSARWYG